MPLSPLFLLFTHTPFQGLSAAERERLAGSVKAASFDPLERDGEITLLDRFLQKVLSSNPPRDSVFVYDVVSTLLDKGVPPTLSPATTSRFMGRLPLTRALLENHRRPSPDPSLPAQLRLANALLDEVFGSRPSGATLAAIDALLESHGPAPMIMGLPALLWLTMQSGPTSTSSSHTSSGWMFSGSASEATTHAARVVRGLSSRLEKDQRMSPAHRWLMGAWVLGWGSGAPVSDQIKGARSVLEHVRSSQDPLKDLEAAAGLAATFDDRMKARTASAFLRAAPVLASPLGELASLGDEDTRHIERLAASLVHHGLRLAWQDSAWTVEVDVLGKPLGLSTKNSQRVVRRLIRSQEGMTQALRLWVATGLGSNLSIVPTYRQKWLTQTIRAGQSAPKRLLQCLGEVGPVFDEALEKDAWGAKNVAPLLAQVRAARLDAALPEDNSVPLVARARM